MNLKKDMLTSYLSVSEVTSKKLVELLANYMTSSFEYNISLENPLGLEKEKTKFKSNNFGLVKKNNYIRTPTNEEIKKTIIEFCNKIGLHVIKYNGSLDFTADYKDGTYVIDATNYPELNEICVAVHHTDRIKQEL